MSVLKAAKQVNQATSFEIWQVKENLPDRQNVIFCSSKLLKKMGVDINESLYMKVWEQPANGMRPEDVFYLFNITRPLGFTGHSMSVSDVLVYKNEDKVIDVLFCDTVGFIGLSDFFRDQELTNTQQICNRISEVYQMLYKNNDNLNLVTGEITYAEALEKGDAYLKSTECRDLIKDLIIERGDIFSSDRETVALAIALTEAGIAVNINPEISIMPEQQTHPEISELEKEISALKDNLNAQVKTNFMIEHHEMFASDIKKDSVEMAKRAVVESEPKQKYKRRDLDIDITR